MVDTDGLDAADRNSGMNPLQYSHMAMGGINISLDEDFERRIFNLLWLDLDHTTMESLTLLEVNGVALTPGPFSMPLSSILEENFFLFFMWRQRKLRRNFYVRLLIITGWKS